MKLLITTFIVVLISCGSSKPIMKPNLDTKPKDNSKTTNKPIESKSEKPKQEIDKQIFSILPYDKNDIDLKSIIPKEDPNKPAQIVKKQGFRIQVFVLSDFSKTKEFEATLNDQLKNHSHIVYVDFYSPNYRLRVGDFLTRDEARKSLPLIKSLGYRDAFIVPDKVNMQSSDKPQ